MSSAGRIGEVRPGDGSLAGVLSGALAALGVPALADPLGLAERLAGVRQIVVLLVDGFGHHLVPRAAQASPFLADLEADLRADVRADARADAQPAGGRPRIERLECAFPSTTPSSLVSVGTGALPGTHGVVGFTVAIPGTERLLTHVDWHDDPEPSRLAAGAEPADPGRGCRVPHRGRVPRPVPRQWPDPRRVRRRRRLPRRLRPPPTGPSPGAGRAGRCRARVRLPPRPGHRDAPPRHRLGPLAGRGPRCRGPDRVRVPPPARRCRPARHRRPRWAGRRQSNRLRAHPGAAGRSPRWSRGSPGSATSTPGPALRPMCAPPGSTPWERTGWS